MVKQIAVTAALMGCGLLYGVGSVLAAPLSAGDQHFVRDAAMDGNAEVDLGNLAIHHASSPAVIRFAHRMVDDHTRLNNQLQQVATDQNFTLPAKIGRQNDRAYNRLAKLSGPAFDRAYMRVMIRDHRTDIAAFRHESRFGSNPAVTAFASESLPTLREHLQMAMRDSGRTMRAHVGHYQP
jgi:putative membrane protein